MRHRPPLAVAICLAFATPVFAQSSGTYTRALPPEKALIERINLKREWLVNLPIDGRKDAVSVVQTLDDQLFVQTSKGLLVAIDILSGRIQWSVQLGIGETVNTYPVAANSQFVFAVNMTKLYAFHRYTGALEFVTDTGSPPSTGLAADEQSVYCVLGVRPGTSGADRVTVYNLPRPIGIAKQVKPVQYDQNGKPIKDKNANPVDSLLSRYAPGSSAEMPPPPLATGKASRSGPGEAPTGGFTGSRTPSLSALPKVTPPYTLDANIDTPSLDTLPTLRQPYRIRNESGKDIQQTASIGTIPPSVAAALALSDLRPKNVEPHVRWEFGSTSRILYPVFLTPLRAWIFTDDHVATGINKIDKKVDVRQVMPDPISAPPGRGGLSIYVPLGSGYLVDIEGSLSLLGGGAHVQWRTTVGGINNRTPFVTDTMVYAQGDNSGVVCVSRKTGEVIWTSQNTDDRVIAATKEFIYIRNRLGRVQVYDAIRATDPVQKLSMPLAGIDLGEFNIPVTDTVTDRLFLAADNGLIVCLRDMSPKYARPVRICPEALVNFNVEKLVTSKGGKDNPPPKEAVEPKKEPMKQ